MASPATSSQSPAGAEVVPAGASRLTARARACGKFICAGEEKLYLRGVTYGPFRPRPPGGEVYDPAQAAADFARMSAAGVNAVRTYTVPPRWLLDAAGQHGLRVLIGIPWEQHVTFLGDRGRRDSIVARVRDGVAACAGHPAVLGYAVGNEIPAPIVRWHGPRRVERFLERLHGAVKEADPQALSTYVNYPTTEYLQLPFLDFVCFNVFLETRGALEQYLYRLHNLADERPLVLTEIGLDSLRHGEEAQAELVDWQVRAAFGGGCAGAFVFAWTDEWHRGGHDIDDWAFGLTTRERESKPALAALQEAFEQVPMPPEREWPRVSVVVATYNGGATLRETLSALARLSYPDYEVIVVDDGSTDDSGAIAEEFGFRVIRTPNEGLAAARNRGLAAAGGDLVAYLDDDAYPDPEWLQYLAAEFLDGGFAGVGGPNLPVSGDGVVADCVAAAPGGPTQVLLTDREAEHIPGCNMVFVRSALEAIGGFDSRFRAAGDDVDVCWRLQEKGWKLGFAPAAVVWHHRRATIGGYLGQQRSYGRAEALLERKWPERYTAGGHITWRGRLYGNELGLTGRRLRWRIYHGQWGRNPFQPLYQPARSGADLLALLPEVYLVLAGLLVLTVAGAFWTPLLAAGPVVLAIVVVLTVRAVRLAGAASYPTPNVPPYRRGVRSVLTAMLHLLQPLARLVGRLGNGLSPWRGRGTSGHAIPRRRTTAVWSERRRAPEDWLAELEERLSTEGAVSRRGGEFDRWDLEVRGGTLAGVRIASAVEEHGGGRQQVRFGCRPRWSRAGLFAILALVGVCAAAAADGAAIAAVTLGAVALAVAARTLQEAAAAMGASLRAIHALDPYRSAPER
jgi:GT2 family glycosyltransferase